MCIKDNNIVLTAERAQQFRALLTLCFCAAGKSKVRHNSKSRYMKISAAHERALCIVGTRPIAGRAPGAGLRPKSLPAEKTWSALVPVIKQARFVRATSAFVAPRARANVFSLASGF